MQARGVESSGDWRGIKCDVVEVLRFYIFLRHNLFRVLSDVGIVALPTFVVFDSEEPK